MHIPFGKYDPKNCPPNGADICFINSGYLKWLINQDWFLGRSDETLLLEIEKELNLRDLNGDHFYEDKININKFKRND